MLVSNGLFDTLLFGALLLGLALDAAIPSLQGTAFLLACGYPAKMVKARKVLGQWKRNRESQMNDVAKANDDGIKADFCHSDTYTRKYTNNKGGEMNGFYYFISYRRGSAIEVVGERSGR